MSASVVFLMTEQPRDLDLYESIYVPQLRRFFYVRAEIADGAGAVVLPDERALGAVEVDERSNYPVMTEDTWCASVLAALTVSRSTCGELAAIFNTSKRLMNAYLQNLKAQGRARPMDQKVGAAKLWEAV